jgi:hypothetical protein
MKILSLMRRSAMNVLDGVEEVCRNQTLEETTKTMEELR